MLWKLLRLGLGVSLVGVLACCGSGYQPDTEDIELSAAERESLATVSMGTDVGNPTAIPTYKLSFYLLGLPKVYVPYSISLITKAVAAPGGDPSARLWVEEVRLKLDSGVQCAEVEAELFGAVCVDGNRVLIPGPIVFDLADGTSSPDLSEVRIPAGNYKRAELVLGTADGDLLADDDDLAGRTLVSQFEPVDADYEVALRLGLEDVLKIDDPRAVDTQNDGMVLALGVDGSSWFADSGLDACLDAGTVPTSESGVYVVNDEDPTLCDGLADAIEHNVMKSGK